MNTSRTAPTVRGLVPVFVPGRSHGPVRSYRVAAWGGLQDGVVRTDSTNRPNGMVRVQDFSLRAVEVACALLLARHSVLDCLIEERDGSPWLAPRPRTRPKVTVLDYSLGVTQGDRETAQKAIGDLVWSKFDVGAGPLYRAFAVRFGADEAYIGLVVHHFVADAISIGILLDEFVTLYDALVRDRRPMLLPVGLRYQDYLLSMTDWIMSAPAAELRSSAIRRLAEAPRLDLGRRLASTPGDQQFFEVDREVTAKARATARECGVSLFTILLAAQNILLRPYTSNENVALKVITTGREVSQLSRVVGNLADRMLVVTDMSQTPSFSSVVERTQKALSLARKHSFVRDDFLRSDPLASTVSIAAPVFNFQTVRRRAVHNGPATDPGLSVPAPGVEPTRPRDAYYLVMYDNGEELWGVIKYGAGEIAGFLDEFEQILAGRSRTVA